MAIFDVIKTAAKVAQEAGKIELYGQILGVYEKLLEQQKRIDDLESDNKTLKTALEVSKKVVPGRNVYWTENDDGGKDGPFCTCCWDSERKLVRLHTHQSSERVNCPNCKTTATPGKAVVYYPGHNRRNEAL